MFDRTIIQSPRGPSHLIHHEHRAPTDESVRLLAEMEKAAKDRIDRVVRVENNGFTAVVRFYRVAYDMSLSADCVFELNGHRAQIEESVSDYDQEDARREGRDLLFEKLQEKVAQHVATQLIAPAFLSAARRGELS